MADISGIFAEIGKFIWQNILILDMIFAIFIVFFQRKDPKSIWAWLLLLYFIPIVGFVFYILFGLNLLNKRRFRIKEIEGRISNVIHDRYDSVREHKLGIDPGDYADDSDLMLYNLATCDSEITDDNDVSFFTDGNEKFNAVIKDILNAREFIHMEYYIIRNDELMDRISEALIKKADEGVKVRILYDAMGCRRTPTSYFKKLSKHENISTSVFFPAFFKWVHLRVNYRNHRKILVIDNRVGYVGGFNVGKEYIDKSRRFGHWRDTHMRITGSAVNELNIRFTLDWNYASQENLFEQKENFVPKPSEHGGSSLMQIISSGPDSSNEAIRDNYLRMIHKAKESIYIQTPYFIPDGSIRSALLIAVRSGVDVNIMIPCKPDHPLVYWATYSYVGELVMAGAHCYTYDAGFMHAKGMIVDSRILCYGSANFDIRSFALNFEVNAVIFDRHKASEMEQLFKDDLKHCTPIIRSDYAARSLWLRFREQFCRLFSPIL